MAISFLKLVNNGTETVNQQTMSLAAGVEVVAGSLLIVTARRTNAGDVVASVSDDSANSGAANVYTVDIGDTIGTKVHYICSSYLTRTIDSDDIISVTWTNGAAFNFFSMVCIAYTGSATTNWFDKGSSHAHFHTQAEGIVSDFTATLAQADELVFGVCSQDNTALTNSPGSGYTERDTMSFNNVLTLYEDKIVAATTAVEATASWSGGTNETMLGIVATYKAAVAAGGIVPQIGNHLRRSRAA